MQSTSSSSSSAQEEEGNDDDTYTMHFSGRWQAIHLIATSNDIKLTRSSARSTAMGTDWERRTAVVVEAVQLNYLPFRYLKNKQMTNNETRPDQIRLRQPIHLI